jgi:hypothetical protein
MGWVLLLLSVLMLFVLVGGSFRPSVDVSGLRRRVHTAAPILRMWGLVCKLRGNP